MNRFGCIFVFCLLILSQQFARAQDPEMDSLKLALKKAKHDTVCIKILTELSEVCAIEDILKYSEPSMQLCMKGVKTSKVNTAIRFFYLRDGQVQFRIIKTFVF